MVDIVASHRLGFMEMRTTWEVLYNSANIDLQQQTAGWIRTNKRILNLGTIL